MVIFEVSFRDLGSLVIASTSLFLFVGLPLVSSFQNSIIFVVQNMPPPLLRSLKGLGAILQGPWVLEGFFNNHSLLSVH